MAFPEGYRRWTHVKSMIVEPGHPLAGLVEGTHHIYANETALRAYRGKRPFADGAVIVFDLLTTVRGDLAMTEGARKAVIVMQKDSRRFAATDGWSYQVFGGPAQREPQLDASAAAGCHGCHTSQAGRDFVFSDWRE
ncbi:MAG: cytochrome P460 family protein [Gammaproteobacteria bacterium]|nr:cytochrome P460 family protein [Gammaproteobacteria bacterium]